MTLEILKMIIMLCSINALEDSNSKWTELPVIERYQKSCRVWYIDCYEDDIKKVEVKDYNDSFIGCIKKRNP